MILLRSFFFHDIAWSRLTTDAAALLVILSLFELALPLKVKSIVFWLFNFIYSLTLFAATLYFSHFGSVPTYTALYNLDQVLQIKSSVQSTVELSNYLYFIDIVIAVIGWLVLRIIGVRLPANRSIWKIGVLITFVVCIAISARYIQLGMPIENELVAAETDGFLNYQVASAIKAVKDNSIAAEGNTDEIAQEISDLQASYAYKDQPGEAPAFFGEAKGKNVIVIQMEAFQNFPIHLSLDGKELTPVLNGLADQGMYFPHIFQQIGQGNTSDAEFMSNTSIYPTGKIAMSTGYGNRMLPSMPRLLQERNYEADTFHVNDVGFWDRSKLYPALNFNHYYDKPFYTNDHFNSFGASDEELYRVGVEKLSELSKQGKPFYAQFVTVSSHFPFEVPEDRLKMKIPDALKGTQLGSYLAAVNYTDYAVGTLIDRLKQNGMWDNTVLVLYGDHFGLQPDQIDPALISSELGITYDPQVSRFNIPLIIHMPGETDGKVVNTVGGQLDIMPTIANLLGVSLSEEKFTAFGHDLLNIDHNVFGMRYYLPTGSFFNNDILFVPGKGFEDGKATSLSTLKPVTDFSAYRKDYDYVLKLMELSDQYVRSLPNRK
ncbi:LTA synthase family protein [Paenibacillus sepulcri]|uniref:LTA synthase family protein n=1 Tax=Paenibacillus sepulcri TaxID=359917 RepID=A0ABS7C2D1_9BACL|nr:LTA synthase family protein [Paenibacillus sepulcri]